MKFRAFPRYRLVRERKAKKRTDLRHAATLTLVGWYLIVPPYVWPYSQRDLRVPISQWKIVQRFDTATPCEDYLLENEGRPRSGGTQNDGRDGYRPVRAKSCAVRLLRRPHLNER